ncbi:MAG: chemotaxis protein CheC [Spirochaetales bacterium]|nr:chemotaxis protein CheC [Spirochaetales bacterium]
MNSDYCLSELELDALGEVMNISFGAAAADLAEVMDIFIHLNIPHIKTIEASGLLEYISKEIPDFESCSVIEQKYHGDFNGLALLIFPYGTEKELVSYFQQPDNISYESDEIIELEREVLMEIGNILIGACIGKLFELINSTITYFPPEVLTGKNLESSFINSHLDEENISITFRTHFKFEDRKIEGYMFLLNSKNSIPHLKKALSTFMGL